MRKSRNSAIGGAGNICRSQISYEITMSVNSEVVPQRFRTSSATLPRSTNSPEAPTRPFRDAARHRPGHSVAHGVMFQGLRHKANRAAARARGIAPLIPYNSNEVDSRRSSPRRVDKPAPASNLAWVSLTLHARGTTLRKDGLELPSNINS